MDEETGKIKRGRRREDRAEKKNGAGGANHAREVRAGRVHDGPDPKLLPH